MRRSSTKRPKYQGLKKRLEQMRKVKSKVVVIAALGAVTLKVGEWYLSSISLKDSYW